MPRYFIQGRGEVTFPQMARHLDIRTLAFYRGTQAFILSGRLSLEDVVVVACFLLGA